MKFNKLVNIKNSYTKSGEGYWGEIGVYEDKLIFCYEEEYQYRFSLYDLDGNISYTHDIRPLGMFSPSCRICGDAILTDRFVMKNNATYPIPEGDWLIAEPPFLAGDALIYRTGRAIFDLPHFFGSTAISWSPARLHHIPMLEGVYPAADNNCVIIAQRDPSARLSQYNISSLSLFDLDSGAVLSKHICKSPCRLISNSKHILLCSQDEYTVFDRTLNPLACGSFTSESPAPPIKGTVLLEGGMSYIAQVLTYTHSSMPAWASPYSSPSRFQRFDLKSGQLLWDSTVINDGHISGMGNYGCDVYADEAYLLYCCYNNGGRGYLVKVDIASGKQEVVCDLPRGEVSQTLKIGGRLAVLTATDRSTTVHISDGTLF